MKIAVMGAGSVGCYFGGLLARAGHDVTLIGRAVHVQAIHRDGLLLDTQTFREHVRIRAESDAGAVKDAGLLLFCVKSIDTESAAASMAPHLAEDAVVLSLQSGVDNAQRLESVLRQRVLPAVGYVATEMVAPGTSSTGAAVNSSFPTPPLASNWPRCSGLSAFPCFCLTT